MVTQRIGAIIQARMGSKRLPGKVLLPLPPHSTTIIDTIIQSLQQVEVLQDIILATTDTPSDDVLVESLSSSIPIYRGDKENVLARFYHAANTFNLSHIVRITGDNPFIDPYFLGRVIDYHIAKGLDYTASTGLPLGCNFEVFSRTALNTAFFQARTDPEKEHVTPFMKSNSQLFKLGNLHFEGYPEIRLTIDNPQDYALACTLRFLLEQLQAELPIMDKIKKMVEEYAWITKINHQNLQVPAFRNQKEEFAFALTMLEPYEMMQVKKALSDYIDE